jgi:hypothetical protein
MIHKTYQPCRALDRASMDAVTSSSDNFSCSLRELLSRGPQRGLTADQLESEYCRVVYAQTRDYRQTGELLGLDWRTVKRRVSEAHNGAVGRTRSSFPSEFGGSGSDRRRIDR